MQGFARSGIVDFYLFKNAAGDVLFASTDDPYYCTKFSGPEQFDDWLADLIAARAEMWPEATKVGLLGEK